MRHVPRKLAMLILGTALILRLLKRKVCAAIASIQTGHQRRALYPIDKAIGDGAEQVRKSDDVDVTRELLRMKDGSQYFVQTLAHKESQPKRVLVFIPGYTSHSDLVLEFCAQFVREGATVVTFDPPGHGRSDGLLAYVADWWKFMDAIWEIVEASVPAVRSVGGQELPVFASGVSMGGGIACCMAMQRPDFFRGIIPIAPMLFVSDDVKPPAFVVEILKKILVPLLPTWPVTPSKDLEQYSFRVPAQGHSYVNFNPLSMKSCKPRLGTAMQMGFVWPDWVALHIQEIKTPFLVLHGTSDKVTDPAMSQLLHDKSASKDKQIILIEGAYHGELTCCLKCMEVCIEGEWLPEQMEITQRVIKEANKWMAQRSMAKAKL